MKMTQLVMHLWIDRAPYSKLVLPDRIRVWNEIGLAEDQSVPHSPQDFRSLDSLKHFILDELTNQSLGLFTRMFQREHNQLLLQLLNLMKMMMEFGFYVSAIELTQVIGPLLKLLQGVYDVSNQDEEEYINNLFAE
jgi:hypothetical protein